MGYSPEEKREAFKMWIKTNNLHDVERTLNIPLSTLQSWKVKGNWEAERDKSLDIVKKSVENKIKGLNDILTSEMSKTSFELLSSLGYENYKEVSLSALDASQIETNQYIISEIVLRKAVQALKKFKPNNFAEMQKALEWVFKLQDKFLAVNKGKSEDKDISAFETSNNISVTDFMNREKENSAE